MPENDALSIYSMKSNPFEQEKCVVELLQGEGRVKYILNPKTRHKMNAAIDQAQSEIEKQMDQMMKKQQNKSK